MSSEQNTVDQPVDGVAIPPPPPASKDEVPVPAPIEEKKKEEAHKVPEVTTPEDEIAEITDCFNFFDRSRQRKLPVRQLTKCLSTLGKPLPTDEEHLAKLTLVADPKATGYFTLMGLIDVIKSIDEGKVSIADVETTFFVFDKDRKGFFTKEELVDVLGRLGNVDDATVENIISQADQDGNNEITQEEFVSIFT